jgi:hypothetical protein
MSWFKEYAFASHGTWTMTGYPPIARGGTASLARQDGLRFVVRMIELDDKGTPGAPTDAEMTVSADGEQLVWGRDTYARQK